MSDARGIGGQKEQQEEQQEDSGDGLLARIGALPRPAMDPGAQARVRSTAYAAYRDAALSTPLAVPGPWVRAWNRVLEPIVVTGVVAGYFAWTAAALGALR
jgi:hypothetical protein